MKNILIAAFIICLLSLAGYGQYPVPPGASKFIHLMLNDGLSKLREQVSSGKLDNIEGGYGTPDWTEVNGRIFLTSSQMEEIGKIEEGYTPFTYNKALAEAFKKRLADEGFRVKTIGNDLYSIRYQKNSTIGSIEVRSFFLQNGTYRKEYIFNESYLRKRTYKSGKKTGPISKN